MRLAHCMDRVADEHRGVRGAHRVLGQDGQLELACRVLGMELSDRDVLVGQGAQHVVAVPAELDQAVHAVGRSRRGGHEVVSMAGVDVPLDLEAHQRLQPALGEVLHGAAGEGPGALRVRSAVLGVAVDRGPRPAGQGGEAHGPGRVGQQPEVTHRPAGEAASGDRVVDEERVEHR